MRLHWKIYIIGVVFGFSGALLSGIDASSMTMIEQLGVVSMIFGILIVGASAYPVFDKYRDDIKILDRDEV